MEERLTERLGDSPTETTGTLFTDARNIFYTVRIATQSPVCFTFLANQISSLMESDDQNRVSRRRFLHSLSIAGVVGASGSLLTACGGGSDGSGDGSSSQAESDVGSATASADCSDLSSLSDSEKQQRKQMVNSLNYVEESPEEKKNCANCQLYQQEKYGSGCGGCQLFPGPVYAQGYCDSWAPKS